MMITTAILSILLLASIMYALWLHHSLAHDVWLYIGNAPANLQPGDTVYTDKFYSAGPGEGTHLDFEREYWHRSIGRMLVEASKDERLEMKRGTRWIRPERKETP